MQPLSRLGAHGITNRQHAIMCMRYLAMTHSWHHCAHGITALMAHTVLPGGLNRPMWQALSLPLFLPPLTRL